MPPFLPIVNYPPNADSLKAGADKLNSNIANTINRGSGVFKVDDTLPQAGLEWPGRPDFFLFNATPSDAGGSRETGIKFRGKKADLSEIVQLALDVFHPDIPGNSDATEARLYMTLNGGGLIEILRIGQDPSLAGAEQAHFYFNPQPYFTDHEKTTFAILGSALGGPAKLKISDVVAGGGENDGINFEANGGGNLTLSVGTPGVFAIPRSGGGSSGRIVFIPHVSGSDYLGVNTNTPLDTWAVYRVASPSMSLQSLFWDSNGPHEVYYTCKAIDGSLGRMGWVQTNYPSQFRKAKWISQAANASGTLTEYLEHDDEHLEYLSPNCALKVTASNVFYSNSTVTDEGLRNEERLSQTTYINDISDFPTSGPDIWFTEGVWDANNIPFAITQDIYLNKGVTVLNLNITTGNKIDIGTDASTNRRITLKDAKINFTGSGKNGLLGGESKTSLYDGFDLYLDNCDFIATASGKFANFTYVQSSVVSDVEIKFNKCNFRDGIGGTFFNIGTLSLNDISIKGMEGGFFASNIARYEVQNFRNLDNPSPASLVPITMSHIMSSSLDQIAVIGSMSQNDGNLIYIDAESSSHDIFGTIVGNTLLNGDKGLVERVTQVNFFEAGMTGSLKEGQLITEDSSGAQGYVIASAYDNVGTPKFINFVMRTTETDFSSGEDITWATGTANTIAATNGTGATEKTKNIHSKGNIGIPDSTAQVQLSAVHVSPVPTICTSGEILRINATYTEERAERFSGVSNGNATYNGLDPITCNVSFNFFGYVLSGPKIAAFYLAKYNLNNTILSIADDPGAPGVLCIVETSEPHGYAQFETTLFEGTTLYDKSYIVQSLIDDYHFRIPETFSVTATGNHAKVFTDDPIFKEIDTVKQVGATRPIDNIKTDDTIFLAAEVIGGDVLYTDVINLSIVKTG